VAIALGIVYLPILARVARSGALVVKNQVYILAARAIGDRESSVILQQVIPNIIPPIIVQATLALAYAILAEAGLSFLGLGTQPPKPSWGRMLSEGRDLLGQAPWLSIFPGLVIMLAVLGFNVLGDALRDALDPRLRDVL
jgi:peptide/nickel transport system permease protein